MSWYSYLRQIALHKPLRWPTGPTGLELLKRVAAHYRDAKSYRLEWVEERTFYSEYQRSWQKDVISAAEAPGGRYLWEAHGAQGNALRVADGKVVWTYHIEEQSYTRKDAETAQSSDSRIIPMAEVGVMKAQNLRATLAELPDHLKSATRLPDEDLTQGGSRVACYVVGVQSADMKRSHADYSFEKTIWIDKLQEVIVKIREHGRTSLILPGGAQRPMEEDVDTIFATVDIDYNVPDSLFVFVPPSQGKLVAEFPDPQRLGPDLSGSAAPALKFKSPDGKLLSLDSFRGNPVLLDIWATWCPRVSKTWNRLLGSSRMPGPLNCVSFLSTRTKTHRKRQISCKKKAMAGPTITTTERLAVCRARRLFHE